jgi:hypothetical protein
MMQKDGARLGLKRAFGMTAGAACIVSAIISCGPPPGTGGPGVTPSGGCKPGLYTGSFAGTISVLGGAPVEISGDVDVTVDAGGTGTGNISGMDLTNNSINGTITLALDCAGSKAISGTINGNYFFAGLPVAVLGPLTGTYSDTGPSSGNYGPVTDGTGALGTSSGTWTVSYTGP